MPNCTDDYTENYLKTIEDFVEAYRKKYRVVPSATPLPELSDFAHGEGTNLLYRRVIPCYCWKEDLKTNPDCINLVLTQIEKDRGKLGL